MCSATPPLSVVEAPPATFFSRELPALKQGIKTGLAGAITYAIYAIWHLPQGYWAVFTALVVVQVTLGASWKPALYRTIGSTSGAIAAIILAVLFGTGNVRIGIELFTLATFFGFLTLRHPSFSAAGFTAAIVLVLGRLEGTPTHVGWLRVLYTLLGSFVAFAVGALLWPVHAREALRQKIANILSGAGALYQAVTAAALHGANNDAEIRALDRKLHDLRRGITQQMDEARSQLTFSRFNQSAYQQAIGVADQVRRRLTAMAEDGAMYRNVAVVPQLVPSLPRLTERTTEKFVVLADAVRTKKPVPSLGLDASIHAVDADLARLRHERATAPLALDQMLPFWALLFNLREVAQDLKQLETLIPQLR